MDKFRSGDRVSHDMERDEFLKLLGIEAGPGDLSVVSGASRITLGPHVTVMSNVKKADDKKAEPQK